MKRSGSSRRLRLFLGVFAVLPLLTVIGCGSSGATVTGTVTRDGKPLPAGHILFHPATGQAVQADITDGQYTVKKVPLGDCKVTVDTEYLKAMTGGMPPTGTQPPPGLSGADLEKWKKEVASKGGAPGMDPEQLKTAQEQAKLYQPVAEKYRRPDQTPLRVTINSGTQTFDAPVSAK
jgi:hypothetical protein